MKTTISIIVAIYNAGKTLKRCLDSLVNQTLTSIEILCIDDGSTDESGAICDGYAERDPRIQVFHKQNEGVSAARQFGLDHTSGEYVIHLDADDYAEPEAYETMYRTGVKENADIIICDAHRIVGNGEMKYMDFSLRENTLDEMIRDLFMSFGSVWNRMIRRSVIIKYQASFPKRMQYGEDKVFLARLLGKSHRMGDSLVIRHIDKPLINYDTTSNPESLSKLSPGGFVRSRMNMLIRVGEEVDLTIFGDSFYGHISQQAYSVLQNPSYYGFSDSDFQTVFGPFKDGIKKKAPFRLKTFLVTIALDKGFKAAMDRRWILAPLILRDKLTQLVIRHK